MKLFLIFLILMVLLFFFVWRIFSDLPNESAILNFMPVTTVNDFNYVNWDQRDNQPLRKYVLLNSISIDLIKPVIISEDDTFFRHSGINMDELKKAFRENLQKKQFARGASTITMQLARNAFLSRTKTITRKMREIVITKRIEETLTKRQILEYYLNVIEWGPNVYGAEAAAYYYFGKSASQLNLAEGSLMAGILPNPIYYNPYENMRGAKRKQLRVLRLMRDAGLISSSQMKETFDTRLRFRKVKRDDQILDERFKASLFDSLLRSPRIPDSLKAKADSTGIIYLPED